MLTSHRLAEMLAGVLGLPPETVRQHLRNLQAAERSLISAKGRGRGAAAMTPLDAARLLLAAAGADFVKDSVAALDAFGDLHPIGRRDPGGATALVSQLAALLTRLATETDEGPPPGERPSNLGLSLISVASVDPARYPRVAILRWGRTGSGAVSFATAGWEQPVISVADYAARMQHAGLIRERHVTRFAMERIARAL
ncbi:MULTISPECIES: hypothetical protein [unclassified Bradyrhizobium]|uniref:hypothetical protein n=1 Tax=unclassified Bradyrhizobium TaxID=2631580 RepID=UPI0033994FAC